MSPLDTLAKVTGYVVLVVATYSAIAFVFERICQYLWEHAKALGMMRDWERWYRRREVRAAAIARFQQNEAVLREWCIGMNEPLESISDATDRDEVIQFTCESLDQAVRVLRGDGA